MMMSRVLSFLLFLLWMIPENGLALSPKEIYQQIGPGVVLILGSDNSRTGSGGTGSIIRSDGLVMTNAHVVISKKTSRPYKKLSIYLKPDRVTGNMDKDLTNQKKATVLYYDSDLDLALLKMENPPRGLEVVSLGDPDEVSIGDPVVAIGHPETGGLWTLTTGAISAQMENFRGIKGKDIFQTETSLNRGNSGGPLLDNRGYLVGINTSISRQSKDGLTITDINFSVKSSVAHDWLAEKDISLDYGSSDLSSLKEKSKSSPKPLPSPSPPPPEKIAPKAEPEAGREFKPQTSTMSSDVPQKRPYNLDHLIAEQMKEMADLMEEMRGKFR